MLPSPVSLLTALLAVLVTVFAAEPTVEVRLCNTLCTAFMELLTDKFIWSFI